MRELTIETPNTSYPVFVGENAIEKLPKILQEKLPGTTRLLVIADEYVSSLHGDTIKQALPSSLAFDWFEVPKGEAAKSFPVFEECLTYALEKGYDRQSCILALGGGATGDLAGYVAASFMRGIPFIQLPTTILAHDSAVGGKVAINHKLGKNMVGHFHQPEAVIYDTRFLKTLPEEEIRSGFAEVIKHALIADRQFLGELMANISSFATLEREFLEYCLLTGIKVKGRIVGQDEKERGIRAYLNFGHTYGHAVETKIGYGGITHGEAVAAGMIFALRASEKYAGLSFDLPEFTDWMYGLGYPLAAGEDFTFEELYQLMVRDKKSIGSHVRFVLLEAVGKPVIRVMSEEELRVVHEELIRGTNT